MGFWGKPNINNLIEQRDLKGLWKACLDADYRIRREAIIGIVKLNEIPPNVFLILSLVNDPNVEVRKIAYDYSIVGEFGLFANVTALHDSDNFVRLTALNRLINYHQNCAIPIIVRSAQYDPDSSVKNIANSFFQDHYFGRSPEFQEIDNFYRYKGRHWLSIECLMDDFMFLLRKDNKNNPDYIASSGGVFSPYSSPLMATCIARFEDAYSMLSTDKNRASKMLDIVQSCSIEGINSVSRYLSRQTQMTMDSVPYQDYLICATIIFTKLNLPN